MPPLALTAPCMRMLAPRIMRLLVPPSIPSNLSHRWAASANKPIGLKQHLRGNRESQGFGGLQIDDKCDVCVRLHRDLCRLRPLENLVHQTRRLLARGVRVWTVARQSSALLDIKRVNEYGWDALLGRSLQNEPLNIPGHRGWPQDPIYLALADFGQR